MARTPSNIVPRPVGGAKLGARARALCHQTIVPARQRTRVDVKKTASPAEIEITQTALI